MPPVPQQATVVLASKQQHTPHPGGHNGKHICPASLDGTPASTPRARTLAAWLDAHAVDTGDYTQAQQDADGNLNATLSEQEVELLCEWVDASRDARGPAASTRYMRSLAGALRELWT